MINESAAFALTVLAVACCCAAVPASLPGLLERLVTPAVDSLVAAFQPVLWRDIADGPVEALLVVVPHVLVDDALGVLQGQWCLRPGGLPLIVPWKRSNLPCG
jgi:hypothetical protein